MNITKILGMERVDGPQLIGIELLRTMSIWFQFNDNVVLQYYIDNFYIYKGYVKWI